MPTIKLSAIYGGVAAGIHIGEVPPGYERPFSAVPMSLCGIGNDNFLEIRWKKTTSTEVTCASCFDKAKELYDNGAELFDPSKPVPGWNFPQPEIRYEFCPIESTDGLIDLPSATTRKGNDDADHE